MSNMTLRLDTGGLRALIADNPEFQVEIQKAVLNNIKDDVVRGGVDAKIKSVLEGLVEARGYGQNITYTWRSQEFKTLVHDVVAQRAEQSIVTAAQQATQDFMTAHGKTLVARYLQEVMDNHLDELLSEEVVKKALDKKLKAALAKIVD